MGSFAAASQSMSTRKSGFARQLLQTATQTAVSSQSLTGNFKVVVEVGGLVVTVTGRVIDGVARIGTAFR